RPVLPRPPSPGPFPFPYTTLFRSALDLDARNGLLQRGGGPEHHGIAEGRHRHRGGHLGRRGRARAGGRSSRGDRGRRGRGRWVRSEEHTSELSHVKTSYAVVCFKK